MKNNKSFQTPSAKPVDVEYRLKRLNQTLEDAMMFLGSIDPSVFPDQYSELREALGTAASLAKCLRAPAKKARGKAAAEKEV